MQSLYLLPYFCQFVSSRHTIDLFCLLNWCVTVLILVSIECTLALSIMKQLAAFEACKIKQKQYYEFPCRVESFRTELNRQSIQRLIPFIPSHLTVCKTTVFDFGVNSSLYCTFLSLSALILLAVSFYLLAKFNKMLSSPTQYWTFGVSKFTPAVFYVLLILSACSFPNRVCDWLSKQ